MNTTVISAVSESACIAIQTEIKVSTWILDGGFLLYFLLLVPCFWGLAFVCEDYFCSSLRILCEELKVPDDVAGATFMAIGTSAADLIISTVSLLVFRSTLGLGTIIGSEIFNHLVVSGAVSLTLKSRMKLDPRLFCREVLGYFMTLSVLWIVLQRASISRNKFTQCLSLEWFDGLILMIIYGFYTTFTIYFESIMGFMNITAPKKLDDFSDSDPQKAHNFAIGSFISPEIPPNSSSDSGFTEIELANQNAFTAKYPTEHHPGEGANESTTEYDSKIREIQSPLREVGNPREINNEVVVFSHSTARSDSIANANQVSSFSSSVFLGKIERILFLYTYPVRVLIQLTIPNLHKNRKLYGLSAIMSCLW